MKFNWKRSPLRFAWLNMRFIWHKRFIFVSFLPCWDNWAFRILAASPHVSFIAVKQSLSDRVEMAYEQYDISAIELKNHFEKTIEPLSMQFERLYHEPAYGEDE